jgi:histidine triad (HIT) family protein
MNECIFCKITSKEIPSTCVYEDDFVFAFRDIYPQAPIHILIVPKKHIVSAAEITAANSHLVAKCFEAIAEIAKAEGLDDGFRVITNSGSDGGQTVFHLHFHLLGGRAAQGVASEPF